MAWTDNAWTEALPMIERIHRLPFLQELANGTLPAHTFHHYISQDSLYLDQYTRVLAHIASRLPQMTDVETFLEFALDGVATEKALHAQFSPDKSAGMSTACLLYTSFLRSTAYEDVAVEAASILPCFVVYEHTGHFILSNAVMEGNPYREWIKTYSDPDFARACRKAEDVCNRLASEASPTTRQRMLNAYLRATELEHLFWHSAYHLGKL